MRVLEGAFGVGEGGFSVGCAEDFVVGGAGLCAGEGFVFAVDALDGGLEAVVEVPGEVGEFGGALFLDAVEEFAGG